MPIKSNIVAGIAHVGRQALTAPRASDTVSGALCQAFATPIEQNDFTTLLARIDAADRNTRRC